MRWCCSVAFLFGLFVVSSCPAGEEKLWPDGLPPAAKAVPAERAKELIAQRTEERISYVAEPSITIHAASEPNGCGVVIFPGGGYNILAYKKEGTEIAEWFNTIGVTAGVVQYRVPRRDPEHWHVEPVQDGQRAIRWMRQHAAELKLDPGRIGVLGFSAGGHLSAMTGMHWQTPLYEARDETDQQSCRPDFMCPMYAAYLGPGYKDNVAELGPLVQVTPRTPPTFLSVTADDSMRGAQSALLFVELKKAGVPVELHVFAQGGHGYGIRGEMPAAKWNLALAAWLDGLGLLTPK